MSVSQNITEGTVDSVSEVNQYKPGKRLLNFRVLTDDQYPVMYEYTLFDNAIDKHIDKIIKGVKLKIQFNIKSREFNERIYYSLVPWAIEMLQSEKPAIIEDDNQDMDEDVPF